VVAIMVLLARRGHGEDRIADEGACFSGRGTGLAEVHPGTFMSRRRRTSDRCTLSGVQAQPLPETLPPPDLASMDAPVRRLFEQVAPALSARTPDVASVATALVGFARDLDYLMPR